MSLLPSIALVGLAILAGQPASGRQTDTPAASESRSSSWDEFAAAAAEAHGELGARAASFLATHRPDRDADLAASLLIENLDHALRARESFPWAGDVPEEIFLNNVLPYAVLDETREPWRADFYERASRIVKGCTTATEAAQALNREIFDDVNVHYDTGRKRPNQSPSESIAQGRATCTGLAIILVDACRAVGIPARAAGVGNWHDKRGNHTWVEIWDADWHFTGADEYDAKGLDRAWFTGDAANAVPGDPTFGVWATSWKKTGHVYPLVWSRDPSNVPGVDVTTRYLPAAPIAKSDGAVTHIRLWAGAERVAAPFRVIDAHGTVVAEGDTKAGTADLNDMPAVTLQPGAAYTIEFDVEGDIRLSTLSADSMSAQTLDLQLPDLDTALSRDAAEHAIDQAWRIEVMHIAAERAGAPDDAFKHGDHTMRILERTFGDEPDDGRSLWISMHGGGGAPEATNDQQWRNQIKLYEPAEGIYIAPRAPTDTWNLWHQAHIDPLFDQLIATCVATRNVNPNKVYLLGYSAGGDGVYQLAPRMADRFAAASMMAGHPNEARPLGLRNLPFAIFMGGKDDAYNRNTVAAEWGDKLDALQEADPDAYPHRLTIFPDYAHWMQGEDKEALPWMASHTRNPWPSRVVWYQDDVTHTRFYWLQVAPEDGVAGRTISARVEGQTIRIDSPETRSLTLLLHDELIDLDRPITVEANAEVVFEGHIRRTVGAVTTSLAQRRDPRSTPTALLHVSW